jgi:hypothetical protein
MIDFGCKDTQYLRFDDLQCTIFRTYTTFYLAREYAASSESLMLSLELRGVADAEIRGRVCDFFRVFFLSLRIFVYFCAVEAIVGTAKKVIHHEFTRQEKQYQAVGPSGSAGDSGGCHHDRGDSAHPVLLLLQGHPRGGCDAR